MENNDDGFATEAESAVEPTAADELAERIEGLRRTVDAESRDATFGWLMALAMGVVALFVGSWAWYETETKPLPIDDRPLSQVLWENPVMPEGKNMMVDLNCFDGVAERNVALIRTQNAIDNFGRVVSDVGDDQPPVATAVRVNKPELQPASQELDDVDHPDRCFVVVYSVGPGPHTREKSAAETP